MLAQPSVAPAVAGVAAGLLVDAAIGLETDPELRPGEVERVRADGVLLMADEVEARGDAGGMGSTAGQSDRRARIETPAQLVRAILRSQPLGSA